MKLTEYKGYEIEVTEAGTFVSEEHSADTLAKLKEWINEQTRVSQKLDIPCLVSKYGSEYKRGTITSYKTETSYSGKTERKQGHTVSFSFIWSA